MNYGVGSIIAESGAATTRYSYGPYGEPNTWTGSRFRYTGQTALPEAQLYHYKARVYDPVLGRFLQTDPVGYEDDLNLYMYVANDPLNRSDPTGRQNEAIVDGINDARACAGDDACQRSLREGRARAGFLAMGATALLAIPGPEDLILASIAGRSVWGLANAPRGFAIEQALGANLPQGFRTIDRFDRASGLATSIKSIDLGARSYQDANRLGRTIDRHVNDLANFRGDSRAGVTVRGDEITGRRLELAVPEGMTDAQRGAIEAATARAAERDVEVVLRVVR